MIQMKTTIRMISIALSPIFIIMLAKLMGFIIINYNLDIFGITTDMAQIGKDMTQIGIGIIYLLIYVLIAMLAYATYQVIKR